MPTNPLTLTRQTLYDLVWSKPMSTLALDFGITDVGLAKRCRAVDVPIPYRGYWARVGAGLYVASPRRTRGSAAKLGGAATILESVMSIGVERAVNMDNSGGIQQ